MPALPVHPCLFILLHGLAHKQLKHLSLNFPLTSLNFPQLFLISPTSLHSLYAKVELYDSNLVYLCAIIKKLINYKDENQQELLAHAAHGRLGYDE